MNRGVLFAVFLCIGPRAMAQETTLGLIERLSERDPSQPPSLVKIRPPRMGLAPVSAAPFSAERRYVQDYAKPDGTKIHLDSPALLLYRDSQGRTRIDTYSGPGKLGQVRYFEIQDPLAGFYYFGDPIKKIAYRVKYTGPAPKPLPPQQPLALINRDYPDGRRQTMESIGRKSFHGVETEGVRFTLANPGVDRATGQPNTEVSENWRAPRLAMNIYAQTKSPSATSTTEMANLSTIDPRLDLFLVPGGYLVEDRQGEFVVELGFYSKPDPSR